MKQIHDNYDECYYLTKEGKVYNSITNNYLNADKSHRFKLKTIAGSYKKVTLRELYKIVYDEYYIIDSIEDIEGEEWKPIERTDELYWISNKGRVKSYKGYEAIILKPRYVNGYERVDIIQEGSRCSKLVSRLVAAAFLLPPTSLDMQLHHKNAQRSCNEASNLEWLTPQQHRELHKQLRAKEKESNAKEG